MGRGRGKGGERKGDGERMREGRGEEGRWGGGEGREGRGREMGRE